MVVTWVLTTGRTEGEKTDRVRDVTGTGDVVPRFLTERETVSG